MYGSIYVIKGKSGNVDIRNTTFPLLKPITEINGLASAIVDASAVFGESTSCIKIDLEEYREL